MCVDVVVEVIDGSPVGVVCEISFLGRLLCVFF